jgi:hypothetical protein
MRAHPGHHRAEQGAGDEQQHHQGVRRGHRAAVMPGVRAAESGAPGEQRDRHDHRQVQPQHDP